MRNKPFQVSGQGRKDNRVGKRRKVKPKGIYTQWRLDRVAQLPPGLTSLPPETINQVQEYLDRDAFHNANLAAKVFHCRSQFPYMYKQKIRACVPAVRGGCAPLPAELKGLRLLFAAEVALHDRLRSGDATVRTWNADKPEALLLSPDGMFACSKENAYKAVNRIEAALNHECDTLVDDIDAFSEAYIVSGHGVPLSTQNLCNHIFSLRNIPLTRQAQIKELIWNRCDIGDLIAQSDDDIDVYRVWDARLPEVQVLQVGGTSYFSAVRFSENGRYAVAIDRSNNIVTVDLASHEALAFPVPAGIFNIAVGEDGTAYVADEVGVWAVAYAKRTMPYWVDRTALCETSEGSLPWDQHFVVGYENPGQTEFAHCDVRGPEPRFGPIAAGPHILRPLAVMNKYLIWADSAGGGMQGDIPLCLTRLTTTPLSATPLPEPFSLTQWEHKFCCSENAIAICRGGAVSVMNVENGRTCTIPLKDGAAAPSVRLTNNGERVALFGCGIDRTLTLWDTSSDQGVEVCLPLSVKATDALFSPDDHYMVTVGEDGTHLWDLTRPKAEPVALHVPADGTLPDLSLKVASSRDGRAFAVLGDREPVTLYHFGLPRDQVLTGMAALLPGEQSSLAEVS